MLSPKTRWSVGSPDPAYVRELSERFGIRPLLAALLAARGHTAEEAAFFLSDEFTFHDPSLLAGMSEAAERIRRAIRDRDKILIYGDYDADGVSSTSLLVRLFRMLEAEFDYRVPHRLRDGYGLHTHYLEEASRDGVKLVVTVDTGITAVEQAAAARRLGLDLIVTDHHEPPETLPDALAVVNPKREDCAYPFKGLAGVGVAFKLAHALLGRVPEELAAWAALGTIADVMPLVGENRSIVKLGLRQLRNEPPIGFAALFRVAGVERQEVSSNTIGFGLAPRINAAGRLADADEAVKLLIADDPVEADAIARRMDALNRERQRMVEEAAAEAIELVERDGGPGDGIVVASDRWNPGIIGIVASRLVEAYYRPTVVIAMDAESGVGKGSARAIPGFHLYDALKTCESLFLHFGGHASAAGLSIRGDNLDAFVEAFRNEASSRLTEELKTPVTLVDAELDLSDITIDAIQELEKLAPYGMGHPAPKFSISQAIVGEATVIGKDKRHAKFRLEGSGNKIEAVGFGIGETVRRVALGSRLSLVGELSVNEWNGRKTPQIIVKDVAVPHIQLFDWRSAATASAFRERWEAARSDDWRPAFLLGPYDEPPAALAAWWKTVPVYRLTTEGDRVVVPVNVNAFDAPFEGATDLWFVNCPFPFERFHLILKQDVSLCRTYALALDGAPTIDRETMKRAYVCMRELGESPEEDWIGAVARRVGLGLEAARLAIRVFRELGFVEEGGAPGTVRIARSPAKRDLSESASFAMALRAETARQEWKRMTTETLQARLLAQAPFRRDDIELRKTEAVG
ncbi:single-stranded-DNA-specific exonuclease RecJ [Paenibacillus sp.]|uniref:single-stranded-DNA-specific exonuclease RecJ n=1 Tax=Paenibacillus sp. TaxID=58172 RepID=UPI002811E92E|nr:single-stranded-DNA-specific exonuclease RecJ [Paenibacillus sp.]